MSTFEEIPEHPEEIPGRAVARVLVATVMAIAASVVIVWALQAFQLTGGGQSDVAHIDLVPPAQPFSERTRLERARRASQADLDRWSWADRAANRVRLPVGVAIDRYLQQRGAP